MKLKQIVCDGTNLNLIKEKEVIKYGEVFEVDDERGTEIFNANCQLERHIIILVLFFVDKRRQYAYN